MGSDSGMTVLSCGAQAGLKGYGLWGWSKSGVLFGEFFFQSFKPAVDAALFPTVHRELLFLAVRSVRVAGPARAMRGFNFL
jgi:hypothetical protein